MWTEHRLQCPAQNWCRSGSHCLSVTDSAPARAAAGTERAARRGQMQSQRGLGEAGTRSPVPGAQSAGKGAAVRSRLPSTPSPPPPDRVTLSTATRRGSRHPEKSCPRAPLPGAPALLCHGLAGASVGTAGRRGGAHGVVPSFLPFPPSCPAHPTLVREPGTAPPRPWELTPQLRGAGREPSPSVLAESPPGLGIAGQPAGGHFSELVKGRFALLARNVEVKTH